MADLQCRVTVVGERKRVDLAVPAHAPMGEYVTTLAGLCGEEDNEVMPRAWTLGVAGEPAWAQTLSLADVGALDGQVLYLRDATDGEYDEPEIFELDELMADSADHGGGPQWDSRIRAATTVVAGTCWLVAAVVGQVLAVQDLRIATVFAAATGVFLPMLSWLAGRNNWPVGGVTRQLLALGGVPSLAAAGWLFATTADPRLAPIMVGVGAVAGGLLALIAKPGIITAGVLPVLLVTAVVLASLIALQADRIEAAAAIALVGYAGLGLAPWAAGQIVTFLAEPGPNDTPDQGVPNEVAVREAITNFVRARRLLAGWVALAGTVLTVTLVVLAGSGDPFALGIAGCLSVALLWRSGGYLLMVEAVPVVLAAGAALFMLSLRVPALLSAGSSPAGAVLAGMVGVMVVVIGVAATFRRDTEPGSRRTGFRVLATICLVACVPLLLGVFGVFHQLFYLGRTM